MPTSSRRAPPPAPAQPSRDLKSQSAPNKGGRPPKRQQPDGGFDAGGGIAPGHAAAAARPLHASPSQPLADMAAGVAAAPSLGVAAAPDPPGLRPLRKLRRNRHRLLRAIRRHRHQQRALLRLRQSIPKEAPVSLRRSPGAAAPPLAVGMVCPLGAWMPSSTIPCLSVCAPPPSLSHSLSLPRSLGPFLSPSLNQVWRLASPLHRCAAAWAGPRRRNRGWRHHRASTSVSFSPVAADGTLASSPVRTLIIAANVELYF